MADRAIHPKKKEPTGLPYPLGFTAQCIKCGTRVYCKGDEAKVFCDGCLNSMIRLAEIRNDYSGIDEWMKIDQAD